MKLQQQKEIIDAAIAGKEIEYYSELTKTWHDVPHLDSNTEFNFEDFDYRIKEIKREVGQKYKSDLTGYIYILSEMTNHDLSGRVFSLVNIESGFSYNGYKESIEELFDVCDGFGFKLVED